MSMAAKSVVSPISTALLARGRDKSVFRALRVSSYSSSSTTSRNLVLYSKPGCCLCDGLKEKIQTAFSLSGPDSLHDVVLQDPFGDIRLKKYGYRSQEEETLWFALPELMRSNASALLWFSPSRMPIRDITSNPEWEKAYQYEIPVLAKVLPDGTEEVLPRLSPRLGVELVQKKIAAALR